MDQQYSIIRKIKLVKEMSLSQPEQGTFFATQINPSVQQPEEQQEVQKEAPKVQDNEKNSQQSQNHSQHTQQQPQPKQQLQLKTLLQIFNSYDKNEKGAITLENFIQIISAFGSTLNIAKPSKEQLEVYYSLSLPSNNSNESMTFDEFLFVFGLCEVNIQGLTIDQQYEYCKRVDQRVIDFLRLLNNYRKKCEKQSIYQQAKKSKQKVEQVRERQYERRKNFLSLIHKRQLQGLEQKQKEKFLEFCQTWDEFMNEYEQTAAQLIKKLGERHDEEMKEFIEKTKEELSAKIRFSKKIVELQDLQKKLVKSQEYEKAQKIKIQIEQLKIFQTQKKEKQDNSVVQLRAQTLKKQQIAAMNTLLQKIQKDRNDQSKQRMSDSQKLIVKSKTLVTQVKHRHTESLKRLYEALHNVSIDQGRIIANAINVGRAKSTYNNSGVKQRV